MNCKPGDLAIVIRATRQENIGCVVEVVRAYYVDRKFGHVWWTKAPRPGPTNAGIDTAEAGVPDAWLRPIRDPVDDAKDETLQWLPSPSREAA